MVIYIVVMENPDIEFDSFYIFANFISHIFSLFPI